MTRSDLQTHILTAADVAELVLSDGEIVAALRPGRERDTETVLFWHRGLSTSDIALGQAMLDKARSRDIGQRIAFH